MSDDLAYGPQYGEGQPMMGGPRRDENTVPGDVHIDGKSAATKANWFILGGAGLLLVTTAIVIAVIVAGKRADTPQNLPSPSAAPVDNTKYSVKFDAQEYLLELAPRPSLGNFTGSLTVTVNTTGDDTTSVLLNAAGLTILGEPTLVINSTTYKCTVLLDGAAQTARFTPIKDGGNLRIPKGSTFKLSMNFAGKFGDNTKNKRGYYLVSAKEAASTETWAITQFEPSDARRAFPCFDNPGDKAFFQVSLVVRSNQTALSNTPEVSRKAAADVEPGFDRITFARTPLMSTYLVAFASGNIPGIKTSTLTLDNASKSSVTVNVRSRLLRNDDLDDVSNFATAALRYFNNIYFRENPYDLNYPIAKMDLLFVPDFPMLAMENWGLLIFDESILLKKRSFSFADRITSILTICHEVAHQWFGNLVTVKTWNELWLQEGISTFLQYDCGQYIGSLDTDISREGALAPDYRMGDQMYILSTLPAMQADSYPSSRPIVPDDASTPDAQVALFDTITYDKGASLTRGLWQLMEAFTDKSFRKGMLAYMNKYKYGNAESADFWSTLSTALANQFQIGPLMRQWLLSANYPVVLLQNITEVENRKVWYKAQQNAYLIGQDPTKTYPDTIWSLQLYTVAQKTLALDGPRALTRKESDQFLLTADEGPMSNWVKLNYNQSMTYRSNYSPQDWNDLSMELPIGKDSKLTPVDRAGLIDDVFALTFLPASIDPKWRTTIDTAMFFTYNNYRSKNYATWAALARRFSQMRLMLASADINRYTPPTPPGNGTKPANISLCRTQLRAYTTSLATELLASHGYKSNRNTAEDRLLKTVALEIVADAQILSEELNVAETSGKTISQLDVHTRRSAIYILSRADDQADTWKQINATYFAALADSKDPALIRDTLEGLTGTTRQDLIAEILAYTKDPNKIRPSDVLRVLTMLTRNAQAFTLLAKHVKDNFVDLFSRLGTSTAFAEFVVALARIYVSEPDIQAFKNLFVLPAGSSTSAANDSGRAGLDAAVKLGVDVIRSQAQWLDQNVNGLCAWLPKNTPVVP